MGNSQAPSVRRGKDLNKLSQYANPVVGGTQGYDCVLWHYENGTIEFFAVSDYDASAGWKAEFKNETIPIKAFVEAFGPAQTVVRIKEVPNPLCQIIGVDGMKYSTPLIAATAVECQGALLEFVKRRQDGMVLKQRMAEASSATTPDSDDDSSQPTTTTNTTTRGGAEGTD